MSSFGSGDPRTEIESWIRMVQNQHGLSDDALVQAIVDVLQYILETRVDR